LLSVHKPFYVMILKDKNAVIYGAGGSLGSAVAKALANAGANVFLTGRNRASLEKAAQVIDARGLVEIHVVDAMNEAEVTQHIQSVAEKNGTVDISFNAIDLQPLQGVSLIEMNMDDFVRPVTIAMQTHFITATAAGKVMKKQGSGVILSLTATSGSIAYPLTGGFAPAGAAIEMFSKNLASELGVYGVRVVNIRSAGSPDSNVFKQAIETYPEEMKAVLQGMENDTMLKKLPRMADIANVAVFLASEMAGAITGVTVDATLGTTAGLSYKVMRLGTTRNNAFSIIAT
jgi:3-oxoacyl-[acyl-carrier protein] reductase